MSTENLAVQFVAKRRVEFCETDMAGIVHFANFYRYMEQAEHEFFRSLGLSIMQHEPDGTVVGWPRVSSQCRFLAPAYYEDVLDVRISIVRRGVKSLTMQFDFWRDDTWVARGQVKTVCCRINGERDLESIEIPEAYASLLVEAERLPG